MLGLEWLFYFLGGLFNSLHFFVSIINDDICIAWPGLVVISYFLLEGTIHVSLYSLDSFRNISILEFRSLSELDIPLLGIFGNTTS